MGKITGFMEKLLSVAEELRDAKRRAAVERILARRQDPAWPKVSADEVRAWTHEGHRW